MAHAAPKALSTDTARAVLAGIDRERGEPGIAARTQAALVRSLVEEISRRDSSDASVVPLHEQLDEEVGRLGGMLHF